MSTVRPGEQMRDLGVVQYGAPVLAEPAQLFDLPVDRETAEQVVEKLFASMERIGQVHPFAKGMGIAAPQIGITRAAAVQLRTRRRPVKRPDRAVCSADRNSTATTALRRSTTTTREGSAAQSPQVKALNNPTTA